MCYRLQLHHKKCGHRNTVNLYCPLAPRHHATHKVIGKFCEKSKKGRGAARTDWKCPREECRDYERLRRYWRCCVCGKGPNRDPFCKMTVPGGSFGWDVSVCQGRGKKKEKGGLDRGRSPTVGGKEVEENDRSSRRRSVSTYRRTCGHQPCAKCTWFGATIPTYNRRAENWTRNGSGSESDNIGEASSQIEPDTEDEPMEHPDDEMTTDTEFDPELYTKDDEDDGDDGDDEEELDRYYGALKSMDVVDSVEAESEDDDEDEHGGSGEDEIEIDAEYDVDDDCPELEIQDHEELTDAEFSASVRRAQRGVNGMSLVEGQEDTDMDSEATISDPEQDFGSDDEQGDDDVDDGSKNKPRGSHLAKLQQSSTTEGRLGTEIERQRVHNETIEEGGPVLRLEGL